MEIIGLEPAVMNVFEPLLPAEYAVRLRTQSEVLAFGAFEDDTPCGVLVFALEETQVRILWLYTAEHMREQGIARELISTLQEKASQDPMTDCLVVDLPRDGGVHPLYPLLLSLCWMPVPFELPSYSFTVGQIAEQDFWKRQMKTVGVYPLSDLPDYMVREYSALLEQRPDGVAISLPLKPERYDPDYTLGYVMGGKLCAVVLFVREQGELVLRYAQAQPEAPFALAKLVYAVGKKGLEHEPPETRVSVAAINDVGKKLIEKLLPCCGTQPMCRMIFRVFRSFSIEKEETDDV